MPTLIDILFKDDNRNRVPTLSGRNDTNRNRQGTTLSGDPRETGLSTSGTGSNDNMSIARDRFNSLNSPLPRGFQRTDTAPRAPLVPNAPMTQAPNPMPMPTVARTPMGPPTRPQITGAGSPIQPSTTPSMGQPVNDPGEPYPGNAPIIPTSSGVGIPTSLPAMFEFISTVEGTTENDASKHGYASPYDITLDYGAYDPKQNGVPVSKIQPISSMTLNQVRQLQNAMLASPDNPHNSSAVGKYQIVGRTLQGLMDNMGLDGSEIFSPELQDSMALALLNGRGYSQFQSGEMDSDSFWRNLQQEWQGFALSDRLGNSPSASGAGQPVDGRRPDVSNLLQQSQMYGNEIDQLYQQMKAGVGEPMRVRDPLESALSAANRVMSARHGTENFAGAKDAEVAYDDGVQKYNNDLAQQEISNLVNMANSQRQWFDAQYDKFRARANEDELRVFTALEATVPNKATRMLIMGELENQYGDRLLTLTQSQITAEASRIIREKGWPTEEPISATDQALINQRNAAAAKDIADLNGDGSQDNWIWQGYSDATPSFKTNLQNRVINLDTQVERTDRLLGTLIENIESVGTPGGVADFLNSFGFNVGATISMLTEWGDNNFLDEKTQGYIDKLSTQRAELVPVYTQLIFEVAKAQNGVGVLTERDVQAARDAIGDPTSWMATPERLITSLVAYMEENAANEYAYLTRAFQAVRPGETPPFARPDYTPIRQRAEEALGVTANQTAEGVTREEAPVDPNVDINTIELVPGVNEDEVGKAWDKLKADGKTDAEAVKELRNLGLVK